MFSAAALALACSDRKTPRDFSEEAERICRDYCSINVRCLDPSMFETESECADMCLEDEVLFEDSPCGATYRNALDCVAQLETCAEYEDANNTHLEHYTCQAEKMAFVLCVTASNDG